MTGLALFWLLVYYLFSSNATINQNTADAIRREWGKDIDDAARLYKIPASRIAAIVGTESKGERLAGGKAGERGLMQLTEDAWNEIGQGVSFSDAWDGRTNIFAGVRYLKKQLDRHGTLDLATGYYNASTLYKRHAYLLRVKANEVYFS